MSNEREPTFTVGQQVEWNRTYEEKMDDPCPTCGHGPRYQDVPITTQHTVLNIFGVFRSDSVSYTYGFADCVLFAREEELKAL